MEYKQYPVPKELKQIVRYFWSYNASVPCSNKLVIKSFADKYPRLIFQDIDNFEPIISDGNKMPSCYLSGLDTKPTEAFWYESFSHFGVSFYPNALYKILGINSVDLVDKTPDFFDIEKTILPLKLKDAKSHEERVLVLSNYFFDKIQKKHVDFFSDFILSKKGIHDANDFTVLLKEFKISERQFQRKFKTEVGITYKNFSRLSRFEKALDLISNDKEANFTQIAYDLGFADQSHLIKNFNEFAGCTPLEFKKNNQLGNESNSFIYNTNS